MTIHKVDIRHFVLPFVIPSEVEESLEIFLIFEGGILVEEWNYTRAYRPNVVRGALYFSGAKHALRQVANDHRA